MVGDQTGRDMIFGCRGSNPGSSIFLSSYFQFPLLRTPLPLARGLGRGQGLGRGLGRGQGLGQLLKINILKIRVCFGNWPINSLPPHEFENPREFENFPRASPSGNLKIPSDFQIPSGGGNLLANSLKKPEFLLHIVTKILMGFKN